MLLAVLGPGCIWRHSLKFVRTGDQAFWWGEFDQFGKTRSMIFVLVGQYQQGRLCAKLLEDHEWTVHGRLGPNWNCKTVNHQPMVGRHTHQYAFTVAGTEQDQIEQIILKMEIF